MIPDNNIFLRFKTLFTGCDAETRAGASPAQLEALQREFDGRLPEDYLTFLSFTDGLCGFIGDVQYLILYSSNDLVKSNADHVRDGLSPPGLILFGSNGGDGGFGFDTRASPSPVIEVPFIDMSTEYYTRLAGSFLEFMEKLKGGYDYLDDVDYSNL